MSTLRLITWNINSIRLRLPLLQRLVNEAHPDIICLQETKCPDEMLPKAALEEMGFPYMVFSGMKGYNGVIILSKLPLTEPNIYERVAKKDSRHVEACFEYAGKNITIHNLYIPAGGDIPDEIENEKFAHKLGFVREMAAWFPTRHKPSDHVIAVGDFNIAPMEHDVWSSKQLQTVVSHTPIEVENINKMIASLNWVDVARHKIPATEKVYSWWSYRNQDWKKSNRGRRLDHIWVTPGLTDAISEFTILKDVRDWPQPSDHVPVVLDLHIPS
jgi:exodeoxyribonuclease III